MNLWTERYTTNLKINHFSILFLLLGLLFFTWIPAEGHEVGRDSAHIIALIDSARIHQSNLKLAMAELDTAYRLASQFPEKKLLGEVLMEKGYSYLKNNQLIKAESNFHQARKILDAYPKDIRYLKLIKSLAICRYFQADYQKVINLTNDGLVEARKQGNRYFMATFLNLSGISFDGLGDRTSAMQYYLKALAIFKQLKLPVKVAGVELNMGGIYKDQGDSASAKTYYLKALDVGRKTGNKQIISSALNNLGDISADNKDFKTALDYFLQSLEISKETNDQYSIDIGLNNVGDSYKDLKDTTKAHLYYDSARVLAKKIGDNSTYVLSLINLAEFYQKFQLNLPKAIIYGKRAFGATKVGGDVGNLLASLKLLNKLYAQSGDYEKAYSYLKRYQDLYDSIYSKEKSLQLVEVQKRYEYRVQDHEMEMIKQKRKTTKAYLFVAVMALLILSGFSLFFIRLRTIKSKALKKQKRFVDNLLEESEAHVVVMDADAKITYISPSYQKHFGRKVEDRVGRSPFDFVHPDDLPQLRKLMESLKSNIIEKQKFFFRLKNQADEYRYMQGVVKNMLHNDDLNGFVLNFWDITDTKEAEVALQESERKYRQIFKAISDIYFRLDKQGIIVEISPSVKQMAGYDPEEITGKSVEDFMEFDGWRKAGRVFQRWGRIDDFDMMIRTKEGKKVHCSLNAHFYTDKVKEQDGFEGTLRDISKRVEAEKELKRSEQELKKANESKDKILSIIGHDLMGPIGTQKSILDMISDEIDDFSKEELSHLLKTMRPTMDATFTMIENLLSWARIMRKNIIPRLIESELFPIIVKSFELLSQQAQVKNIQLLYEGTEDVQAVFDKNLIEIVMRNLLSNAIKFSKPGGRVVVKSRDFDGSIELSVTDQGIGMTDNDILKVYRETEKMESKVGTNREKGTGLGLVIVKEFVQKNNGELRIESKPNQGTTFYFRLAKE